MTDRSIDDAIRALAHRNHGVAPAADPASARTMRDLRVATGRATADERHDVAREQAALTAARGAGLPDGLAERVRGDSPADMAADAQAMADALGYSRPGGGFDGGPRGAVPSSGPKHSGNEALRAARRALRRRQRDADPGEQVIGAQRARHRARRLLATGRRPSMTGDVLTHVDAVLAGARQQASAAVDRAEALRDLRGVLYDLAARHHVPVISPEQLFDLPADEDERAHLTALIDRAFTEPTHRPEQEPTT